MAARGMVLQGWAAPLGALARLRPPAPETLILTTALALFAVSAAAVIGLVWFGRWDVLPAAHVGPIWAGAGVALALASAGVSTLWWRASLGAEADHRNRLRLAVALVATTGAALSLADLVQTPRAAALAAAAAPLRDYRFVHDPGSRTLRVTGAIGPGFAAALRRELRQTRVARLEIASDGGLVREALAAARTIQRRGLTVVARDHCASACVILLMGGESRWADYDMALEFHAVSSITPTRSDWWLAAAHREGRAADRYLIGRGVPAGYLSEARRLGPERLLAAPSIDLVEQGVLTGLVGPDGEALPIEVAVHDLSIAPRPVRYDRAERW